MNQIIEKAYAKINLGLQITGKRPDGYHLLSMVMQTVSLYDKVGIYAQYSYFTRFIDMDELAYYGIPVWVAQYKYPENSLKAEYPACHHVAWQWTTHDETQDENEWYGF